MAQSRRKFKRMRYGIRKTAPPTTTPKQYCSKDIAINLKASERISGEHGKIHDERYFSKYPRGVNPYGFRTGASWQEWRADIKELDDLYVAMIETEIKEMNDMVYKNWMEKQQQQILSRPLSILVHSMIQNYAKTQWDPSIEE